MPKRVLIVDDHYIVRSGMRDFFEFHFGCDVEEAVSKKELMEYLLMQKKYDIILLDINLPDSRNLSLIPYIKSTLPEAKICVFSMLSPNIYAEKAINLGAACYIHKSENQDSILKKIKKVITGKSIKEKPSEKYKELKNAQHPFLKLSEKEFEIALLILNGKGNKEISAETDLKQSTISTYRERIFTKLGISNNIELYEMALRYDVI